MHLFDVVGALDVKKIENRMYTYYFYFTDFYRHFPIFYDFFVFLDPCRLFANANVRNTANHT